MEPSWANLPDQLPAWLLPTWLLAFGLVIGSFLNVVIHRLPRGEFPGRKRSACPHCDRQIRWYENVPVVSWLALRGRCAGCAAPISPRYVLVELLAGGLALTCWFVFGWSVTLPIALVFSWAMLALVFIDLEHMLLPDAITLPGTLVGLSLAALDLNPLTTAPEALLGVLLAIFLVEGLNLAYRILRGMDGLGQGDTKMLMCVGAFLGWQLTVFTLVAASALGALVSIPLVAWASRRGGEPEEEPPPEEEEVAGEDASGSALAELLPEEPEDLLGYLTYLVLGLSFLAAPLLDPARSLGGFLIGLVAYLLLRALTTRGDREAPAWLGVVAALPLLGALAGCPPSVNGGIAAAILGLLWLVGLPLLRRVLPGRSQVPEEEEPLPGLTAGLQAALPLGVFLGIAALVALFAGEDVIGWYLDMVLPPQDG